jgi:hypothetical protein
MLAAIRFLSSRASSNNLNTKCPKSIDVVLIGYVTLSLSLRAENIFRMFENRVLRGIFKREGRKLEGAETNDTMKSLIICVIHETLI